MGANGDWDFRISDLVKNPDGTYRIFNLCGEFRWSPEGPVSSIHYPQLHFGAPGIFSGQFGWERESGMLKSTGSYRTYSIPGKTAALVPEFAVENLPSAELQPRFLRLQCRICPWAERSNDDDDDEYYK